MKYTYNAEQTIRTTSNVEKLYNTNRGFIGRLENVDYKQSDGSWKSQGARWLINESDPVVIMDNGFKSAKL
ncbi:hypothetical protein [Vibrio sp. H11]|uniref:hypothetical protein n=1 Tax=Vibrio sp. H11 TaxID=2565928 RepID=UPI0010A69CBD|nr:hypothetical protein [Vibrio sp. H11]